MFVPYPSILHIVALQAHFSNFIILLMLYGSSNNGDLNQDFFDCSLHRKHKEKCNGHFIRVKVLERLVLKHIQAVMGYILRHEDYFRTIMEDQLRVESSE